MRETAQNQIHTPGGDCIGAVWQQPSGFRQCAAVVETYFDELQKDVSWFCKKFDYRYNEEPWYNSKDAVERAIKFIRSDIHNK